ncbi:hypothetical protein, conserved [Eimeria tenella]|uniref:Uncharacterized protein n=1 Tax=Eimeria tenella TaxID=5802 RepID=U6L5G5_EIMTE|nr:hypothetical protein, conserved [Eimeria tenella]CDJ43020.1 hypothetical protein, conserved [Eimeria tenella]|eukprot:XP_013233770.1 hypothetical protein, conserved [Eimeria tenella]
MGYRYSQPLICNSPFSPLKLIKSIGFTSYFVRLINEGGFVQPLVAGLGIFRSLDCTHAQARFAHKFAAPECPNLLKLRKAIEQNFKPICFYVKNDYAMGHHVYDQHFYGILCSPLFEGKSYKQINAMVDRVLEPLGLGGRVKLHCQPPSRFEGIALPPASPCCFSTVEHLNTLKFEFLYALPCHGAVFFLRTPLFSIAFKLKLRAAPFASYTEPSNHYTAGQQRKTQQVLSLLLTGGSVLARSLLLPLTAE